MAPLNLDPRKTALVIIDLQRGVVARPSAPYSSTEVKERSSQLAKAFRAKRASVVYVRVDMSNALRLPVDAPPSPPPPFASASELEPDAGFQTGDILITKRHWGAFAGTDLEKQLKTRGIDTSVLTGISTNIGVESTARQGAGLGFAFVIVEDACAAVDAEAHRYSFEKIFPRLARVRATADVLAALA